MADVTAGMLRGLPGGCSMPVPVPVLAPLLLLPLPL